jgi:D-sedoheptulose 7-phosphate isomerase
MYFCGNGGSAADAQHLAAELAGKFYRDRKPLPAVALHTNSSFLTAVANDYSYDEVFSRATESLGCRGDILMGISASGNSINVLKALAKAKEIGMVTFGLTGRGGKAMLPYCDLLIKVPSDDIPRIQENHITIGHILCEGIECQLF